MPSPIPLPSSIPTFSSASSSSARRKKTPKALKASTNNSDLTEANVEEFNRRNNEKYAGSSPYYRGLLYFNRVPNPSRCPDREIHGSISTVFFNCFKGNREHDHASADPPPLNPGMNDMNSEVSLFARGEEIDMLSNFESSRISKEVGLDEVEIESSKSKEGSDSGVSGTAVMMMEDESGIGWESWDSRVSKETVGRKSSDKVRPLRERVTISTDKEFVWADRYRPKALKDFICNRDKAKLLQNLVIQGECGHFIFEGPPGVGKKTMVRALLREAFGPERLETKDELKEFRLKGESSPSIKVNVKVSSEHVEVDLSESRGYEKHIIIQLMEELNTAALQCDCTNCRVIVLYQADRLSSDAQHYIRWIMELYKGSCKIVFCCADASKIQLIRSVCTRIQLLPPSQDEIVRVLEYIADQEGIELPRHLAERVAENSKQNLRQAIRSLEASWQANYPFKEDPVILTGWEEDIATIAKSIINEQGPKQLYFIRGKLQSLCEHNISPDFIFFTLVGELKKHLDAQFQPKIDALYLEYNPDNGYPLDAEKSPILLLGRQEESRKRNSGPAKENVNHFMRIEEFTAKFMSSYKSYVKKV